MNGLNEWVCQLVWVVLHECNYKYLVIGEFEKNFITNNAKHCCRKITEF